ncbi:MAG: metallophosphoesterase [Thermoleophilia bacterium]|nr:metallophosphoesterase [Thermoleophilia bacterium]
MDPVRILHVSDFHFDGSPEQATALREALQRALEHEPDVVVHSGDVTSSGTDAEFARAAEVLELVGSLPLIVVPGNRDVRELALRSADVSAYAHDHDESGESDDDEDVVRWQQTKRSLASSGPMPRAGSLCQPEWNANGTAFARAFGSCNPVLSTTRVCAVGLNTNRKVYANALETARAAFGAAEPGAVRILVGHHPVLGVPDRPWESLEDVARNNGSVLELALQCDVDLICSGHLHRSHTGVAGLDARQVELSMAPTLTLSSRKKDRGFHLIELRSGAPATFQVVRNDDPEALARRQDWIVHRRSSRDLQAK